MSKESLKVMGIFLAVIIVSNCSGRGDQQSNGASSLWGATHADEMAEPNPEDVTYGQFVQAVVDVLKEDTAFLNGLKVEGLDDKVKQHDDILNGFTNGFGMTFKYITPGTFMMGSPEDEPGRGSDETRHQVTLTKAFMMQTTEVTQRQWEAVLTEAEARLIFTHGLSKTPGYFDECGIDCPIENVSWEEVDKWINILNQLDEGIYSLPTEAQWEYAARAGGNLAFANGGITETGDFPVDPVLDLMGWYLGNKADSPHPTAQKTPNVWGLYDMHGNVWEWCKDWYGEYPAVAMIDPTGVPAGGMYRVLRGGGWVDNAEDCRSANRFRSDPDSRGSTVGFRLVRLCPSRNG